MFPRRPALIALAALVIAGCVSTASNVTTRYYTVSGKTADEIDDDLRRQGPLRGHALAVAAISFAPVSVRQRVTEGGCVFEEALFRVNAEITLPRWRERNRSADAELRHAWDSLADYARAHEEFHVTIAEKYARLLGEQVAALPAQPTCEALDARAAEVVRRVGRAHHAEQLAFDAAEAERLNRLFAAAEAAQGR